MASSSSIVLPSISAKTPIFTKALNPSISFFSPSLSLRALSSKPISISSTSLLPSRTCRFLPKVAVYDDQEQEEDLSNGRGGGGGGGGGRSDANFPPELKLFVGNLPFTVDSGELAGLFGQAGNVEVVEVIYDKVTGRSRGFGFVTMSTPEEAQAAERQFNGYELDGRPIRVNSGPPPRKDEGSSFRGSRGGGGGSFDSSNRLYVGNLSWAVDDEALADLFSEQGTVTDCKVVFDRETGRSRGFGFVTYSTAEEVNNAISSLNGVDLKGREIRVTVAEARPPRRQF